MVDIGAVTGKEPADLIGVTTLGGCKSLLFEAARVSAPARYRDGPRHAKLAEARWPQPGVQVSVSGTALMGVFLAVLNSVRSDRCH